MLATQTIASNAGIGISQSVRIQAAVFAGLFGFAMLYFVAFAHSDVLHNAAHDVRHAITAPCH